MTTASGRAAAVPCPARTAAAVTPAAFIQGYIRAHEGGLSLDPVDRGNWHRGQLVGSNFGVTGDVLALHRKVAGVTAAQMAALTLAEAVTIGVDLFYDAPRLDLLPWNRLTASVLDMGWGAGPKQAIKLLQRTIAVADDGQLGLYTARAFAEFLRDHGEEAAARFYGQARNAFYDQIIAARPGNAKYRNGWRNRTASFLPGTAWWAGWARAAA